MRTVILKAIAILSCSIICAGHPEKVEMLSSKVILQNESGYFVLSDGSHWKVIPFLKRWRSPSEWWNNIELIPKSYDCVPSHWFVGTEVRVYSKSGNLTIDPANASNEEALKQCTHLLVNPRNEQVLFAIALHPAECLVRLFEDSYQDGYEQGFSKGTLSSHKNATDIYNKGHSNGYTLGYREGYQAALSDDPRP